MTKEIASQSFGFGFALDSTAGFVVNAVDRGGLADTAQLNVGDHIVFINGKHLAGLDIDA